MKAAAILLTLGTSTGWVAASGPSAGAGAGSVEDVAYPSETLGAEFVVPDGVEELYVDVRGAPGGSIDEVSLPAYDGGRGGRVLGVLTVSSGSELEINVGGAGIQASESEMATGGVNGGGDAGGASAGGGGGSDIRVGGSSLGQRVVVAGGGGGASSGLDGNSPGPGWGGGLAGGGGNCGGGHDGGGATSTAGGSGGPGVTFEPETYDPSGEAGSLGEGGDGGRFDPLAPVAAQEEDSVAATPLGGWGGGGGGGLFGGGGGGGTEGAFSGCGGGGSALAPSGAQHQAGVVADAQVRLFWCPAELPTLT